MTVGIDFEPVATLSYAMAHNQSWIIDHIQLVNHGPSDLDAAVVSIVIRDDEGPVSHECTGFADIPAGGTTRLTVRERLRLNPSSLLQSREARPGRIEVTVSHDDTVLGTAERDVRLLAGAQWLRADPVNLSSELLAAYVLPNDPAVTTLLAEAADHLQRATGRADLDGYQSQSQDPDPQRPERADAIAAAIWAAAQARGIRYAQPPASWSDQGQKIRTPAEVLEGRIGTCLDTTVALAAAFEQAGLRPLLWLLRDHAFLGYWRYDDLALGTITAAGSEVINAVDAGYLRLIETTNVTDPSVPFEATGRNAMTKLGSQVDEVVYAVNDVIRARKSQILPLPVRRQTDAGVQVIEYQPAAATPRQMIFRRAAPGAPEQVADPTPPRVAQWKTPCSTSACATG